MVMAKKIVFEIIADSDCTTLKTSKKSFFEKCLCEMCIRDRPNVSPGFQPQSSPTSPNRYHLSVTPHIHFSEMFQHITRPSYPRLIALSAFLNLSPRDFHQLIIHPFQVIQQLHSFSLYKHYDVLMLQYLICILVTSIGYKHIVQSYFQTCTSHLYKQQPVQ